MSRAKVTIIGAGQVGATTAQRIAESGAADVMLLDIADGFAAGKALDLMEAAPVEGHEVRVEGSADFSQMKDSSVVVVTAGLPRKPGMSRDDLLAANAAIISSVSSDIKRYAPESIVIVVTNPLDIMTDYAARKLGFDRARVMGMAGVLDGARMRYFIADHLGVAPHRVEAMVLGGHGDLMVPVMSQATLDGKPIEGLSEDVISQIVTRTQNGGAEIVKLLKTGSAFYAPASSSALMVRSILRDENRVLPVCAYCDGEYGINGMYCGVPARIGRGGVQEIVQIDLSEQESKLLQDSADKVKSALLS